MDTYFLRLKVWIDSGTLPRMSEPASSKNKPVLPRTYVTDTAAVSLESGSRPGLSSETNVQAGDKPGQPRELGGPSGPEPTRYGDWERKGRCIDF
jgi:hypothetical protein